MAPSMPAPDTTKWLAALNGIKPPGVGSGYDLSSLFDRAPEIKTVSDIRGQETRDAIPRSAAAQPRTCSGASLNAASRGPLVCDQRSAAAPFTAGQRASPRPVGAAEDPFDGGDRTLAPERRVHGPDVRPGL